MTFNLSYYKLLHVNNVAKQGALKHMGMFKNKKKTIVVCIAMFFITLFLSLGIAFQESFLKNTI